MTISSEDPERLFSTNGDSGAIVLTIQDGKHHGIGVIYGGNVDIRDTGKRDHCNIFEKCLRPICERKKHEH